MVDDVEGNEKAGSGGAHDISRKSSPRGPSLPISLHRLASHVTQISTPGDYVTMPTTSSSVQQ